MTPAPSTSRTAALTALAMVAFACNSLLCRLALQHTAIDAASFTTLRLASGAIVLWLIALGMKPDDARAAAGDWRSAFALFAYAAAFSFAYVSLPASIGALLLFAAVQATMIGHGLRSGERFGRAQLLGFVLALAGLVGLLAPGLSAPPLGGSLLMIAAGVAWGAYSVRGQHRRGDPTLATASNFARAVPFGVALSLLVTTRGTATVDVAGAWYAFLSGAFASGVGYAIWYAALPGLRATTAATVQLSVPVLTAIGGILLLGEDVTLRLALASAAVLGGIALVVLRPSASSRA